MSFSLNHPNIITIEDVLFLLYILYILYTLCLLTLSEYLLHHDADVFLCVCLVQFFPMKILEISLPPRMLRRDWDTEAPIVPASLLHWQPWTVITDIPTL